MQTHTSTLIDRGKSTLAHFWASTPDWLVYLAAVIGAAAWLAASMNRPVAHVDFDLSMVRPELGHAYLVKLGRPQGTLPIFSTLADSAGRPTASQLDLYEGDRPVGPPHSLHEAIRKEGEGRYSHWGGYLYFSTSDNTDPRTNGRTYGAVYPLQTTLWFDAASFLLVLTALIRAVSNQWSRFRSVILMGSKFLLDPAVGDRRRPWAWFILGLGAVGIAWLYIFELWWTGETVVLSVAGIFPVSDSLSYHSCAREIVDRGHTFSFCHRRPIYASYFASLWVLSDRHLETTLLLQAALLTVCILLFAKEAARWLGFGVALVVAIAVFLWAQKHTFALVMTENIGLALGLLALALLLNAAGRGRLAIAHLGLAVLTFALHARAGAFFVLPFVVLWIGYLAHKQEKSFFLHSAVAVLSVICATFINSALVSSSGGDFLGSHGNFSYVLYGLSVGGEWSTVIDQHPELAAYSGNEYLDQVFRLALENIWNDPTIFFRSLLKNAESYRWVLFDYAHGPIDGALRLAWAAGIFVSAFFTRSDPRAALLLAITLGEMVSAPVIAGDGGARIFAATSSVQPLLAAYAVVRICQTTVLRGLYASFTAHDIPAGEPLRAAYAMMVLLGIAIVLPHSPVRKAFAETPVTGIEACGKGYETVAATLHRNAVVLTVRGDASPTRVWPIRVHYRQLAAGILDNSWFKSDFRFDSPIQIIQAGQLLDNDFGTTKLLFWTGRDELPRGRRVQLCVDRSEKRSFAWTPYHRIVSYRELD